MRGARRKVVDREIVDGVSIEKLDCGHTVKRQPPTRGTEWTWTHRACLECKPPKEKNE